MDTTCIYILCLTVFLGNVLCHESDEEAIDEISNDLEGLAEEQTNVKIELEKMEVEITDLVKQEIKKRKQEKVVDSEKVQRIILQQKLEELEEAVAYLEDNLHDEEATDAFLESLDGERQEDFIGEITEIQDLARSLRNEINIVLQPVASKLEEVKTTTNERNVVLGGVLYYGGIGTSCSANVGVCFGAESECRDGKCQCVPGLSSDSLQQRCIPKCENGYGKTYQTVSNYIIRGFNNLELSNVTLDECKSRCENEASFVCRTIDYFPYYYSCYLSERIKGDAVPVPDIVVEEDSNDYDDNNYDNGNNDANAEEEDEEEEEEKGGWEYNAAGLHLQRDCAI